ncbi:hypothetical protein CDD81_2373 [Ophiocordyceps australis]|uniref:Uncharacterized protein n=1 Tax=Ophiocordyceps australis TaxID=1399860 RepID=A0A2C5XYY7_9HYPO|nr:hypothetical protein CDD81_2373 [Ophiocordyceps australis]
MKTCTLLLVASSLATALSMPTTTTTPHTVKRQAPPAPPAKHLSSKDFDPDVEMTQATWKAKNKMFNDALARDDYDWTQAYRMNPIVKDIACSRETHIMFPNRHLDCERKCKRFFQHKMRFLGVPIYKVDTEGVWGYHFFPDGGRPACMPRRACWLRKDWERKEKVLVYKLGGRAAYISALGGVEGDVEVEALAFSLKGLSQYRC